MTEISIVVGAYAHERCPRCEQRWYVFTNHDGITMESCRCGIRAITGREAPSFAVAAPLSRSNLQRMAEKAAKPRMMQRPCGQCGRYFQLEAGHNRRYCGAACANAKRDEAAAQRRKERRKTARQRQQLLMAGKLTTRCDWCQQTTVLRHWKQKLCPDCKTVNNRLRGRRLKLTLNTAIG